MPLRNTRILIVEDEPILAWDLETIIRDAGGDVVGPAMLVSDALLLARVHQISVAVLDVWVGNDEVFPVASCLADKGVPFVFHTGHASGGELQRRWPHAPVLTKPVATDRLISALASLVKAT